MGKILVFEPEELLRKSLNDAFKADQYQVQFVDTIEEISAKIDFDTECVLLSLFSPDLKNHKEIIVEMQHQNEKTIFIGIAHFPDEDYFIELSSLGIFYCLSAPFEEDSVIALYHSIQKHKDIELSQIMEVIANITGMELNDKNITNLRSRLSKRAQDLGLKGEQTYLAYFKENAKEEVKVLVSTMTTHTTYFFRESGQLDYMYEYIFPNLLKLEEVHIWSAACSTGEEVYSIAIALLEYIESNRLPFSVIKKIKIIGSDIDQRSVNYAKNGVYTEAKVKNISKSLIQKYFDIGKGKLEGHFRIKDQVHALCEFRTINLVSDIYPDQKFHIILARHVLMYFKDKQRNSILKRLQSKLDKPGHFLLSFSESNYAENIDLDMVYPSIFYRSIHKDDDHITSLSDQIRVLVVDDSPFIVKKITEILSKDSRFKVIGKANNPIEAMAILENQKVDLMTLDINMPVMDGLTYLDKVARNTPHHPQVVLISSVDLSSAEKYFNLDDLPFHEFIEKPDKRSWDAFAKNLREICFSVYKAKTQFHKISVNSSISKVAFNSKNSSKDLILIGASTGGVDALSKILPQLPSNTPPVIIAQHMPPVFTKSFAVRMDSTCAPKIVEIENKMKIEYGHVYICPGGKNTEISLRNRDLFFIVSERKDQMYVPSINMLFDSALHLIGIYKLYVSLLTGMGDDGALALQRIRSLGGFTVAQDEGSSTVYGMPRKAVELGGAEMVSPLPKIFKNIFLQIDQNNSKDS